jgi:hypothetical protein
MALVRTVVRRSIAIRALIVVVVGLLWAVPSPVFAADLDCADFGTREAANRELDRTLGEFGRDIHNLDADGDGNACERNGSAIIWSGVGAAAGILLGFGLSKSDQAGDDWGGAIGHAVAAAFAGAFIGWLLPGILPNSWTVAGYAIGLCAIAAIIEYSVTRGSTAGA